jgi:hypothetical protein
VRLPSTGSGSPRSSVVESKVDLNDWFNFAHDLPRPDRMLAGAFHFRRNYFQRLNVYWLTGTASSQPFPRTLAASVKPRPPLAGLSISRFVFYLCSHAGRNLSRCIEWRMARIGQMRRSRSDRRADVKLEPGMHISSRTRHGVAGVDSWTRLPAESISRTTSLPALRVAPYSRAIRRAKRQTPTSDVSENTVPDFVQVVRRMCRFLAFRVHRMVPYVRDVHT